MTTQNVIALEARLRECVNVLTLGLRPNFSDYTCHEADLIRSAEKIYYPTAFYADLFDTMGKKTFPSYHTYKFAQDKIKQSALFTAGVKRTKFCPISTFRSLARLPGAPPWEGAFS